MRNLGTKAKIFWLVALGIAFAFLLATAFRNAKDYFVRWHAETPVFIVKQIATNLTSATKAQFLVPHAKFFALVIGVPEAGSLSGVSGTLVLSNNLHESISIRFQGDEMRRANWLSDHNLNAYIIPKDTAADLDNLMRHGSRISIDLELNGTSLNETSLWITYIQNFSQLNNDK